MNALDAESILEEIDTTVLTQQRWFRDKRTDPHHISLSLIQSWPVKDENELVGVWMVVEITSENDRSMYQLPLVFQDTPDSGAFGTVYTNGQQVYLVDGSDDTFMVNTLLSGTLAGTEISGREGMQPYKSIRRLDSDSSNTLCIGDENHVIKLYRRLGSESGREARLMNALTEQNCSAVPKTYAVVEHGTRQKFPLAVVQEWMSDACDGWDWLTECLADGPTHDVLPDVELMAHAVADVHVNLSQVGSRTWRDEDASFLRERILRRVIEVERIDAVPQMTDEFQAIRELVAILRPESETLLFDVHGDLHLGQLLRHSHRYVLIDFEGEPIADTADRMTMHPPQKDIAGMIRSFEYAAGFARKHGAKGSDEEWTGWNLDVRACFLSAYFARVPFSPAPELLTLFLIEKALYEIGYEASFRPDWVDIPCSGIRNILTSCRR